MWPLTQSRSFQKSTGGKRADQMSYFHYFLNNEKHILSYLYKTFMISVQHGVRRDFRDNTQNQGVIATDSFTGGRKSTDGLPCL